MIEQIQKQIRMRTQIEMLRGYPDGAHQFDTIPVRAEIIYDAADTLEKLLAVYEAALWVVAHVPKESILGPVTRNHFAAFVTTVEQTNDRG